MAVHNLRKDKFGIITSRGSNSFYADVICRTNYMLYYKRALSFCLIYAKLKILHNCGGGSTPLQSEV